MDNIQHLLTQQSATTKRKPGNESRRSSGIPTTTHQISQHRRTRRHLGIISLTGLSISFGRDSRSFFHSPHYISLLFPAEFSRSGLLTLLISASFVFLGRKGNLQGGALSFSSHLLFPVCFSFLSAFYFRFPTGDLHHEINDVCVREEKE